VDVKGKVVVKAKYEGIEPFAYGLSVATSLKKKDWHYVVINAKGKEVLNLGNKYDWPKVLSENMILVEKKGSGEEAYGIVNLKGKELLPVGTLNGYEGVKRVGDLIIGAKDRKWGAYDLNLNVVIPFEYQGIQGGYECQVIGLKQENNYQLYRIDDLKTPLSEGNYKELYMDPASPYIVARYFVNGNPITIFLDSEGNIIF
jgi:hypothetical protein